MMSEANSDSPRVETVDELAAHLGGLPEPSEDPVERYIHPGKAYTISSGGEFTITAVYPDAPGGGVVEFQLPGGGVAVSEHRMGDSGTTSEAMDAYEPEDADTGVITVNGMMKRVRELEVGERDGFSYEDAFWDWMDAKDTAVAGDGGEDPEPVADGGEDPREVLTDVSGGERLTITLSSGEELTGEVSNVARVHADLPGERTDEPRSDRGARHAGPSVKLET